MSLLFVDKSNRNNLLLAISIFCAVVPCEGAGSSVIAKNCHITKNNIYASNLVDTTCKQLILPNVLVEKGSNINFVCTIMNEKKHYTINHAAIEIIGNVTMTNSKDSHNGYRFQTEKYFDKTNSFLIDKTTSIHATIDNLKFIFKNKKVDQVRIACEYDL